MCDKTNEKSRKSDELEGKNDLESYLTRVHVQLVDVKMDRDSENDDANSIFRPFWAQQDHPANYECATGDFVTGEYGVHRALSERHISMIAIAGTIGTGLFLDSGLMLAVAGPAGLFIAYCLMGALVCIMMICLGEMIVFAPRFGGFIKLASHYCDPALGFAMSVKYLLGTGIGISTEMTALPILVKYWKPDITHVEEAGIVFGGLFLITMCNVVGVRYFGEVEFTFSAIKVVALVALIIFGIAVNCGAGPTGHYIGGRNWLRLPFNETYDHITPKNLAAFLGFWKALAGSAFSYGGVEGITVMAGEAKHARVAMAKATRKIFYRVVGLYIVSVLMIGLNVPRDDPYLLNGHAENETHQDGAEKATASSSAWVLMADAAGIKALPSVINAILMVTAFSAGNEQMYMCTRTMMTMAGHEYLPKVFLHVTRFGTPILPTIVAVLFGSMGCLTLGRGGSNQAFIWLTNLSAMTSLIVWACILVTSIFFRRALKAQNANIDALHFRAWFQPYIAAFGLFGILLVITFNGLDSFLHQFQLSEFIAAYVTVGIFFASYFAYKLFAKTHIIHPKHVDLSFAPKGVFESRLDSSSS